MPKFSGINRAYAQGEIPKTPQELQRELDEKMKKFLAKGNDSANIRGFDEFADIQAGRYENVNWGTKWEQQANASSEDKSGALWDLLTEWIHNPRPEYNAFFNKKALF